MKYYNNGSEKNKLLCSNEKFALPFVTGNELPEISCKIVVIPQSIVTLTPTVAMNPETGYQSVVNHM